MAQIELRLREVWPIGRGPLTLAEIKDAGTFSLELDLARVLQINALAVPYRGPLLMRLVQREMALVLALFHHTPPGAPLTRHPAYDSSSSHIRRFVTEVAALGVLNAAVEDVEGVGSIAHFDALPQSLRQFYPFGGTRPDLRFALRGRVLAGESRGRNRPPPSMVLASASQLRRLDQLLDWSRKPTSNPVCMAWTWLQPGAVVVDYFRLPKDVVRPAVPEDSLVDFRDLGAEQGSDADMPFALQPWAAQERYRDRSVEEIESTFVRQTFQLRESQLADSAPETRVPGLESEWFGDWLDVESLDNEPGPRLLFAATRNRREERAADEWNRGRRSQAAREAGMEVAVSPQTMVAIDWRRRDPLLAGEAIEYVLARG